MGEIFHFGAGRRKINVAAFCLVTASVGGATWIVSCVGDDPTTGGDNSSDGGGGDVTSGDGAPADGGTSDGGADSALTIAADQDPTKGNINEVLTVRRLANEGSITGYNIYWGTSASAKLTQLTTLPKTGGDLTYTAVGAIPATATKFLVFGANTDGTESQVAAAAIRDNFPIYIDITQSTDAGAASVFAIGVDQVNAKFDVVAYRQPPVIVRCDLSDTTGATCILVPMPAETIQSPDPANQALVDTTNNRLIFVVSDTRPSTRTHDLFAYGCGLSDTTGASCTFDNLSLVDASTVQAPAAFIDSANHLVVGSQFRAANGTDVIDVARCNLGSTVTGCIHNQGPLGGEPSVAFDSTGPNYDVAMENNTDNVTMLGFDPTNLDFDNSYDAGAGQPEEGETNPSLAIDTINNKALIVVANSANGDTLGLVRCNLNETTGSTCKYIDISAGQPAGCADRPHAVVDVEDKKLFVVTTNDANDSKLGLFRCELDGTGCGYIDFSVGQGVNSGSGASVAYDSVGNRLLVVTNNGANGDKPGVFVIGLW